ncbi:trypsin-like peptidase domain-containing protein [Sulfurimonas sp. SAG-AH-194-I05]|nr:hypothetical protein [Sulfurimonas sp. SAG-AH-194-I05]MDF1874156.1 trypsin-like peptidase domain-containing protein [Sulfurimonas sp. SAG-AH-194-I05]
MKKIILVLLITLRLYSSETIDKEILDTDLIKNLLQEVDADDLLKIGSSYLKLMRDEDPKGKAIEVQDKLTEMATKTLKKMKLKIRHLNIQEAQDTMYEVKVLTNEGLVRSATAVALNSTGKLMTSYRALAHYKKISVIDTKGNVYDVRVGRVSAINDLAYLYINSKNAPYVTLGSDVKVGEHLYILRYDGLLLSVRASQMKNNYIILNAKVKVQISGGVFNEGNELVAILTPKDILNKTFQSVRPVSFTTVNEKL